MGPKIPHYHPLPYLCAADLSADHLAQDFERDRSGTWPAMPAKDVERDARPRFWPLQLIVSIQQKEGVRGRSGICTQKRLPNAPLTLFVVTAAIRAVTLLTRFTRNPTAAGLAIHHLTLSLNIRMSFKS